MKATIKNYLALSVIIEGKKYECASEEALIQFLLRKDMIGRLRQLVRGQASWIESIKRGDGIYIDVQTIYHTAYSIFYKEKTKYKKPAKRPNAHSYGSQRGYLFSCMEHDPIDRDEPRGKHIEDRGVYWYDDAWLRKTEHNWKSFRKNQYK